MSNLILSSPHCHRLWTILGRMCILRDLNFTLQYIVVSQQFDKHLYLTSCLNAQNHNTCTHLLQNRLYSAKDEILLHLSRSINRSTSHGCHGNHHNNLLNCMISGSVSLSKCHTSTWNYPLDKTVIWGYLVTAQLLQQQNKRSPIF